MNKTKYTSVSDIDSEDAASESTQRPEPREGCFWRLMLHPVVPWTLCFILGSISLLLAMMIDTPSLRPRAQGLGTFAEGYATDFITARKHIQVSQLRFTGGPAFDEHGRIYVPNPSPKIFVGDPAQYPEIDYNWDNLTYGRYVLVTQDEAISTWGEDNISQYWDKQRGGYVTGFDMFHTLHCLNNLRKALNPSYYGTVEEISHGVHKSHGHKPRGNGHPPVHQDHCIEQIRQYIMCSGDMTPIPTKYYPGLGRNYVKSDVPHTCRNFDALHNWMVGRYDGLGAVKPVFE